MKLVEILARELEKWPSYGCVAVTQDGEGDVFLWKKQNPKYNGEYWVHSSGDGLCPTVYSMDDSPSAIASDQATAIVTREMWQAERDRIAKPGKKANADGWVRHRGGNAPVKDHQAIEYRMRSGQVMRTETGGMLNWRHGKWPSDIMAYRINKPAEQPVDAAYVGPFPVSSDDSGIKVDIDFPSGVIHIDGPLAWRDRIREIDCTVEALEEERVSLIQRLEGEGLQLLQGKGCGSVLPGEDMSDWRNWKVGDLIECVNDDGWMSFIAGGKYALINIGGGELELVSSAGNHVDIIEFMPDFKWHSRPSA